MTLYFVVVTLIFCTDLYAGLLKDYKRVQYLMYQGIELTSIVSAGHNVDPKHHQEQKAEMEF